MSFGRKTHHFTKDILVDILLESVVFPTGIFLRLLPGKEVAKIDGLKMPMF